jgi:hypothetical protein
MQWHPQGRPPVNAGPNRYWASIFDILSHSNLQATTPVRQAPPPPPSWQPPILSAKVVTSGLADGPTGY